MTRYRLLLVIVAAIASFCFTGSTRAQQTTLPRSATASALIPPPPPPPTPPGFVHHPAPAGNFPVSSPGITKWTLTPQQAMNLPPPAPTSGGAVNQTSCCYAPNAQWTYQEVSYPAPGSLVGSSTGSGTYIYVDPNDNNPNTLSGGMYQYIGSFETGDGLFIQVGLSVEPFPAPGNAFGFFAFNSLPGSLTGLPVSCDPNLQQLGAMQSFGGSGCIAPIGTFCSPQPCGFGTGNYADLELVQSGTKIQFWVYTVTGSTGTWFLLMSVTDPSAGAGFAPAHTVLEYTGSVGEPDIWNLIPPLNMRAYFEFVWQNLVGQGTAYTKSQVAGFSYHQITAPNLTYTGSTNPACPPFEQKGQNLGSYGSYWAGNWGDSPPGCPGQYPPGSQIS